MPNPNQRQIGPDDERVLEALGRVVDEWLIPFLNRWISAGSQPNVSGEGVSTIAESIESLPEPPDGYAWLPEFLNRVAESKRFNRRNLVNIHPTPHVPSAVAALLTSLQNPNNIVEEVSGPTTELEDQVTTWMAEEIIGFDPDECWGNVVSGGTIANLTALLVARDYANRKLARPRPAEIRKRGLYGQPPGVVLATAGSHYSVQKALWVLGMGDENVIAIPVAYDERIKRNEPQDATFVGGITDPDWKDRIDSWITDDRARGEEELQAFYAGHNEPFSLQPLNSELFKALYSCFEYGTPLIAYVFTVGTTDTGTIERPDSEALRLLAKEDVFLHADAAAGGFALFHPRARKLVKGLERVHSVTIDPHKFGFLAYPNGAVLFRDKDWKHSIMQEAPYLRDLSPTIEGSRPGGNIAALWVAMKDLGAKGYESWFDRLFAFSDALQHELQTSRFQILNKVDLTTFAVAPRSLDQKMTRRDINDLVVRMHNAIKDDEASHAWLVNLDKGLASVKVRNVAPPGNQDEAADLVDIYCLRMVATNPSMEPSEARKLVAYLEEKLDEAAGAR